MDIKRYIEFKEGNLVKIIDTPEGILNQVSNQKKVIAKRVFDPETGEETDSEIQALSIAHLNALKQMHLDTISNIEQMMADLTEAITTIPIGP